MEKINKLFEFAKYTEITDFAFRLRPNYKKEGYVRFFICPDVHDTWFVRILEGYNEDYEKKEGSFLLERNKISNEHKGQRLTIQRVKRIILDDDGSNWDVKSDYEIENLIDIIDGGFGIINKD